MESKIDHKQALRVFSYIVENGEKRDGEHHYRDMSAGSDFDGYTIWIKNEYVCLTIFFHSKANLEYSSRKARGDFFEELEHIDKLIQRKREQV